MAAEVALRLLHELETRTAPYPVPFRVVVHNVTGWKIREYWGGAGGARGLGALARAPAGAQGIPVEHEKSRVPEEE